MEHLHPIIRKTVSDNRRDTRASASRGSLPNVTEDHYVLVAREDFTAGEKLSLRWHGLRRVVRTPFGLCLSSRRSTERRASGRLWLSTQVLFGQELERGSHNVPCSIVRNGRGRCNTYEAYVGRRRSVQGIGRLGGLPCLRIHFRAASERVRRRKGTRHTTFAS